MTSRQHTNYATNAEYADYGGLFVMRHRVNSMMVFDSTSTSKSEDVCFIDSSASHHMTSHQEWFCDLRTPDRPSYIETRDDTKHPIRHIDKVPSRKEGEQNCIKNVLHVPTITKNLVTVPTTKDASSRKMADSLIGDREKAAAVMFLTHSGKPPLKRSKIVVQIN